jgi:hypothetical protein
MKLKFAGVISILLVFTLAMSCAKPPTAEMNTAIEAVTRAENDPDAALYAGNSLARARDSLHRMQTEAEAKRYDAAKNYAAEAVAAADKAIADGRTGAARAREEAAMLVAKLPPAIAETEQSIRAAQEKKLALNFDAINQDFDAARRNADQAQTALSGSRYQDALNRGRDAQAGLGDIKQRLSGAATAASRKK